MAVSPAKTQISLDIRPSFFMRTAKTDQTGRMPRLIRVFAERTLILLVLSCRGSHTLYLCDTGSATCVARGIRHLAAVPSSISTSGTFFRGGHEKMSTAILPLLLIQVEQLSVSGEKKCTKYW